jgi:hypothetical protein
VGWGGEGSGALARLLGQARLGGNVLAATRVLISR